MRFVTLPRAVLAALAIANLVACSAEQGIQATEAWSRAMPPGASVGVAYLTIRNRGPQADTLISASTPHAKTVELHATRIDSGVASMQRQTSLDIAAGQEIRLDPGALHFMLMELNKPLVTGERFSLTLEFANSAAVTVEVSIRNPGE